MGVYVKYGDGSMHWDESKADPNDNGGSVINADTGMTIPGANRNSGSTGPGGNGVTGTQANPNGQYHAGPSPTNPAQTFGSGGFSGLTGVKPTGNTTPFANYVANMVAPAPMPQTMPTPATPAPGQGDTSSPWGAQDVTGYAQWQARQAADAAQQAAARSTFGPGTALPASGSPYAAWNSGQISRDSRGLGGI